MGRYDTLPALVRYFPCHSIILSPLGWGCLFTFVAPAQLIGDDGQLKPFEQWSADVRPIADHQCRHWLRTEYNTAVRRAHEAAEWQRFEAEADALTRQDAAIIDICEERAISEMKSYLAPVYDVEAVFGARGEERHPLVLMMALDIAVYHI